METSNKGEHELKVSKTRKKKENDGIVESGFLVKISICIILIILGVIIHLVKFSPQNSELEKCINTLYSDMEKLKNILIKPQNNYVLYSPFMGPFFMNSSEETTSKSNLKDIERIKGEMIDIQNLLRKVIFADVYFNHSLSLLFILSGILGIFYSYYSKEKKERERKEREERWEIRNIELLRAALKSTPHDSIIQQIWDTYKMNWGGKID